MSSAIRSLTRGPWVLLLMVIAATAIACTAEFDLYGDGDSDTTTEVPDDGDVTETPDETTEADDEAEDVEEEIEIPDTRDELPPAATCPPSGEAPEGGCLLALVDEPFVPTTAAPVWTWVATEIGDDQYNGVWIDLDVYHDGWRAPGDLDRHNLFKAQVAPAGATVLPDSKIIGFANASPPNWVCLEQGFSASKPLTKLQEGIEPGYWHHVRYEYFPASERRAFMDITRDGASILNNGDDFLQAADVARMRVTSTEEVVFTLGFPTTHPVGVVTSNWEYRNLRVITFACGDGFVDQSEDCDPGTKLDSAACDSDCTAVVCGDNHFNAAVESCDDGNTNDGDACPGDCTVP